MDHPLQPLALWELEEIRIGVPELASDTLSRYIDKAVALAGDPDRMTVLRSTLRDKMANAPLTDEPRFVKEMEEAFRFMWQDFFRSH